MDKGFEKFLRETPPAAGRQPIERKKRADEILDESDLTINVLGILKIEGDEKSKETQIGMLPAVKKLIASLREVRRKNDEAYDREAVKITLDKLTAEENRIEAMIN